MTNERCPECGFEYDLDRAVAADVAIVATTAEVVGALTTLTDEDARERRDPQTWSPLEYACHLRDVFLVQRERVLLARRVDEPDLVPMGRDERAVHDGYEEQDPEIVARQLTDAALMFANVLARLDADAWERTVIYNYPAPTARSLRWVAVHTEHEARHHLADIRRQP
jgi:hypothetical protein